MDKSTKNMLMIGGAGIAALMLFKSSGSSTVKPGVKYPYSPSGSTTTPLATNLPPNDTWEHFLIIRDAMIRANPNIGNSNYTLTDSEARQYLANYLDLQQGLSNNLEKAKRHWKTEGVAEKRVFLPLNPPFMDPFIGPPPNQNTSKGFFGNLLSKGLGVLKGAAGVLTGGLSSVLSGVDDEDRLTDKDLQVVVNGAAIAKDLLPMFYSSSSDAIAANGKIDQVLNFYLS